MNHDYHVHSNYSDGRFLRQMLGAAERAGLDAVGVADHCNVSTRSEPARYKRAFGFNLDITYERRREALRDLATDFDLNVYDAVEMDYHPADHDAIASFLADAEFEYAIGSVHELDGVNVHFEDYFAKQSAAARRKHVTTYFDRLVELIESDLFAVAAHVDLVERNSALRDTATDADYRRVAEAFADSRTVPELNAGRVLSEYGEVHPTPQFMDVLVDHDVSFVFGTDSHEPDEIDPRKEELEKFAATHGVTTTDLDL